MLTDDDDVDDDGTYLQQAPQVEDTDLYIQNKV